MRPAEVPTEGFWAALGRKWASIREKAAQRAAARAERTRQHRLESMSEKYEAAADEWTELHFAATVNGRGRDQADFDPLRKNLSKNLDYLAHMQSRVPVDAMTYSQIRSEQTAISEMQKAVAVYARTKSNRDPWDAVEAKILTKRSKDLQQAYASEKYAPARQEEKQREDAAQKQRQADHEAAMQAKWDAAEAEWDEAKHLEQTRDDYVDATLPLIQRARKDPEFAARITRWDIDLDRPDREVARDDTWRRFIRRYEGRAVWAIVTDEAKEADRKAAQSLSKAKALDEHTDLKRPLSAHKPEPPTVKPTTAPKPSGSGSMSGP